MDSSILFFIAIIIYFVNLILTGCIFAFVSTCDNVMDSDLEANQKLSEPFKALLENYRDKSERVLADSAGFLLIGSILSLLVSWMIADRITVYHSSMGVWITIICIVLGCFLYLLFGVYLPYFVCIERPLKFLPVSGYVYHILDTLFTPLFSLENHLARRLAGFFGVTYDFDAQDVTEEEILSMVNEGHEQGAILGSEAQMIQNILDFDEKIAKDIMVHRPDIVGMDGEMDLRTAIDFVVENHFSRYPVYLNDLDHIVGLVHIKELLEISNRSDLMRKKIRDLDGLLRPIEFVPETHGINTLFTTMQLEKSHMVIIVDEYGQTSGLVAMEDILEEIVGNIEDEHDEAEESVEEVSSNTFLMSGSTELHEVEELLEITFPDHGVETLNGFIINQIHRIPEEHEEFDVLYQGYCFHICDVNQNVIREIEVSPDRSSVET